MTSEPTNTTYFETYCDKPYDRHHYKIVLTGGQSMVVEDYSQAKAIWHHLEGRGETIEVLDVTKKRVAKGF